VRLHNNSPARDGVVEPLIDVSDLEDVSDLLSEVDLMITDYSSIIFDFAVTMKSMIFLVPDLDLYRGETRGFYLDYERTVPGPVVCNGDQLPELVSAMLAEERSNPSDYSCFQTQYSPLEDGAASERAVELVWGPVKRASL
jgi:CDP-glycerol glycerophosphotransferase (TagB/SpsB family)